MAAFFVPSLCNICVLWVVRQFEFGMNTPKAFANSAQRLERSDNPGYVTGNVLFNPEESVGKIRSG
jgi:hypothetical protein